MDPRFPPPALSSAGGDGGSPRGHRRVHSEAFSRFPDADMLLDPDSISFSEVGFPSLSDDPAVSYEPTPPLPTQGAAASSLPEPRPPGGVGAHMRDLSLDAAFFDGLALQGGSGGEAGHKRSGSMDGASSPSDGEYAKKAIPAERLTDLALLDPKRAKRILAKRQSAARYKQRKIEYTQELERMVQTLQTEVATLSQQPMLLENYHYGEFTLSSGSNITAWTSSEMSGHTNELTALESMLSDASAEPTKLSYALLKSVTRNFSQMIGRGGFGAVYLGILPKGNVAVKKLSILQDLSNNAFVDEIICLKKAHHGNVVRLLGYCAVAHGELMELNGTHVIAEETQRLLCFEYVPNGDLHDYIKEKCLGHEWKIRYQMIKGICHGLHYLHKQRISHLDLKPENVLLDANMEPKITDFGLSRFLPEGQSRIMTHQIFGTLGSIAPELINSGEISFKTDIYGLGIIITKLLTRDNNYDFENWHKSLDVDSPQEKCCIDVARKCVDFDPRNRPTIGEIICKLNEMDNTIHEEESPAPVIQ